MIRGRKSRKVIAVRDGKVRIYESVGEMAKELQVTSGAVVQALENGCKCLDYEVYDTPERYAERIEQLEQKKKEVEAMLAAE